MTDRAIIVFRTNRRHEVQDLLRRLPRERLIGPLQAMWTSVPTLGWRLYVHRRYRDEVWSAADDELWSTRSDWTYDEAMALRQVAPVPGGSTAGQHGDLLPMVRAGAIVGLLLALMLGVSWLWGQLA